jgi:hypothetical protein
LKVAEGVAEPTVRRWLADTLATHPLPEPQGDGVAFFEVVVGRVTDMSVGSPEGDAWTVDRYVVGSGGAPTDWPRRSLSELVAFALDDLNRAP